MRQISPRGCRPPPGPGSILITATVQRQTAGLFVAEDRGATRTQGGVGAHDALSRRSRERRRPARRRARSNPARRARGGARSSRPALGARAQGRGPTCADRRRAWPRQVEAHGGVSRPPRRDAAHLGRVVVVAAVAEHAAASDRRMGPASASARTCPPNSAWPTSRTLWV